MSVIGRGVLAAATLILVLVAVPASAGAVLSGTNGRILMVSGRDHAGGTGSDATAKLYLRSVTTSVGGGSIAPIPTATGANQHRHPTWAPDRTQIAYAHGPASCNAASPCDIFTLDLTNPNATPQNITQTPTLNEDRPAWSPDGTRIAYEGEATDGGNIDIFVDPVGGGIADRLNLTDDAPENSKAAWTPDSQTLYYTHNTPGGTAPGGDADIMRRPANGSGMAVLGVPDSEGQEFQPSISPDGTEICFTFSTGGFDNSAEVLTAPLASPATQTFLSGNPAAGDYNCTWSPDGDFITYVTGIFGAGDLVMERSDNSGGFVTLETTAGRFDGNPDWAPDARPACEDTVVTTTVGTPVEVPLECADTGPAYERTEVRAFVSLDDPLENGTVSTTSPQTVPASVTYTPNRGFLGNETMLIKSADEFASGDRNGVVTIRVEKPSNDFQLGKAKRNKKRGTAKLAVSVPHPGDLELDGTSKVKPAEARANQAGDLTLQVKPTRATKAKLAAKGKAKVKAEVTYKPDDGDPNTKSKRVTLKLK